MENNRLSKYTNIFFAIYLIVVISTLFVFLCFALNIFYQDYNEYCIYVSQTEFYHFLIKGKQGCKIKWPNFLEIHFYYLIVFFLTLFILCFPAMILIKKEKKNHGE